MGTRPTYQIKRIFFLLLTALMTCQGIAQEMNETGYCRLTFNVNQSSLEEEELAKLLFLTENAEEICRVELRSGASPEGRSLVNRELSDERARYVSSLLSTRLGIPESRIEAFSSGIDWEELVRLVSGSDMPYREETIDIIRNTPVWVTENGVVTDSRKRRLMNLNGGEVWKWMQEHLFSHLRYCSVRIHYRSLPAESPALSPVRKEISGAASVQNHSRLVRPVRPPVQNDTIIVPPVQKIPEIPESKPQRTFRMSLRTNLLYDLCLVPNIGIDFHLGRGWAIGGSWKYAWWKNDEKCRYWRIYGGELNFRKYFGRTARRNPLGGHHIGIYGQLFTYDFLVDGQGYIGGIPGGTLWDRANYGGGIEYGYSLPIGKRLNLDFSIGIGYQGGSVYKYIPIDGEYVWQETVDHHSFGPTKVEISLVWLLGHGNTNDRNRKGGRK